LNSLTDEQHATLDHEDDSYFDGYQDVHDCTLHVLQFNGETYEEVETYELSLPWDEIVTFHNG
jgi:hypothetical protein